MGSLPPLLLAGLIVAAVTLVGGIIALVRSKTTFTGYEDILPDVRVIAKALDSSQIFRDGGDLVIAGNYQKLPAIVRFSYDENTPGVNIHMKAPATFTMSVVPKGERATEGRVVVRTPDEMFDARFTTRSDNPTQAKMFVGGKVVGQMLQKLCCSSKTFFTVTQGALELSELVIPMPYTGRHISDHLDAMRKLAREVEAMPGSESVKIRAMQREGSSWLVRAAVIAGAIAAVVTVVVATREYGKPREEDQVNAADRTPEGVLPLEAPLIPGVSRWRLAQPEDFNRNAAGWMRGSGEQPAGRLAADFRGSGNARDAIYVLVNDEGMVRVVMLANGVNRYDVQYEQLGIAARVPKGLAGKIEWAAAPVQPPDGDGLLIVRSGNDPASGVVLFLSGTKIVSGAPVNYQRIDLR